MATVEGDDHPEQVTIPEGTIITVLHEVSFEEVRVRWDDQTGLLFIVDLLSRGTPLKENARSEESRRQSRRRA